MKTRSTIAVIISKYEKYYMKCIKLRLHTYFFITFGVSFAARKVAKNLYYEYFLMNKTIENTFLPGDTSTPLGKDDH
jgi:hypothetical protein